MNTFASIALFLFLAGIPTSLAGVPENTITVDGVICTLADAITSANTNTNTGGCLGAVVGVDVIELQADVVLETALPPIESAITLFGNDHVIDGVNSFRVFNIWSSGRLNLDTITIKNGHTDDYGGGIYVFYGDVYVEDSTFYSNTASNGGGIFNDGGFVTVENSTFYDNTGGGIFNQLSTTRVNNSTFYGNQTGILNGAGGTVEVSNSTLYENLGFGISNFFFATRTTINNSVIANTIGGVDCFESDVIAFSLVGDGSCGVTNGDVNGNKTGDPQLGPLQDNGGPTLTFAPVSASSPVVDAGSNALIPAFVTTDQRGAPRIWDGDGSRDISTLRVDMGSVEYAAPVAVTLVAFDARANQAGSVHVSWETATESDNAGFNVYRSALPTFDLAHATRINPQLIAAQGSLGQGASYSLTDSDITPGNWYYYLEDVDLFGASTLHGPTQLDTTTPTAVSSTGLVGQSTPRPLGAILLTFLGGLGIVLAARKRRVRAADMTGMKR